MKKLWNISIEPNVCPGLDVEPLLGEFTWHSLTNDPSILEVSKQHFDSILAELDRNGMLQDGLRILEVGAYAHVTGYMFAEAKKAKVTLSDISPSTLHLGYKIAMEQGYISANEVERIACDFHDLPFESNYFDVVFIASALHHTWRYQTVLSELARVTIPGGLLILHNEPIRRELCLYGFRTNRPDEFTQKEITLHAFNLLRTIAEPYFGSRAEQLFGMIENQEMTLDEIVCSISKELKIQSIELSPENCMGEFEKQIDEKLQHVTENHEKIIFDIVTQKLSEAESDSSISNYLEKIMLSESSGYKRLFSLIERISKRLELKDYAHEIIINDQILKKALLGLIEKKELIEINRAILFGGSLRLVAKKKAKSNDKVFLNRIIDYTGIVKTGFSFNLGRILNATYQLFPHIQQSSIEDLKQAFGPDWNLTNINGISIAIPNKRTAQICIEHDSSSDLLICVRVFGVVKEMPWTLGLYVDEELRAHVKFDKNDSALLVASISNAISPNILRFQSLENIDVTFNVSILSVIQVTDKGLTK